MPWPSSFEKFWVIRANNRESEECVSVGVWECVGM
jgi:hypothetical protein